VLQAFVGLISKILLNKSEALFLCRIHLKDMIEFTHVIKTRFDTALHAGRLRVRFPLVSLDFFIDILPASLWPWGRLASNSNEYEEHFLGAKGGRCAGLTNVPHQCADCLEIWEHQPPGTFRVSPVLYRDWFTFLYYLLDQDMCVFLLMPPHVLLWISWSSLLGTVEV
jgi:hypothetical protein